MVDVLRAQTYKSVPSGMLQTPQPINRGDET